MPYDIRCHHKVPLENGGTDKYSNVVLVTEAVHLLIHATLEETMQKYLKQLQLNKKQLEKLNRPVSYTHLSREQSKAQHKEKVKVKTKDRGVEL